MGESTTKTTSPIKKVRFNEKVQVFIIQSEIGRSETLQNLPADWIQFAHAKPLSGKLKDPLNQSISSHLSNRCLTSSQYATSQSLINFYLQRRAKKPFTYWDVVKASSASLALSPTVPVPQKEAIAPPKNRMFPGTPFPHQTRLYSLGQSTIANPFQRRSFDKHGQISEILAIYGNNPSLRVGKDSEPKCLIGNFKDTKVGTMNETIRADKFDQTSHKRVTSSAETFPYLKRSQRLTQPQVNKSTHSFSYK